MNWTDVRKTKRSEKWKDVQCNIAGYMALVHRPNEPEIQYISTISPSRCFSFQVLHWRPGCISYCSLYNSCHSISSPSHLMCPYYGFLNTIELYVNVNSLQSWKWIINKVVVSQKKESTLNSLNESFKIRIPFSWSSQVTHICIMPANILRGHPAKTWTLVYFHFQWMRLWRISG